MKLENFLFGYIISGWGYTDVLPYFMKSEDVRIPELESSPYRGRGGYLTVEHYRFYSKITDVFLQAGEELGYPIRDINGAHQIGFTKSQGTLRDGLRCSTAKAFLRPITHRKNLYISLNTHVEKIIVEGDRGDLKATGVLMNKQGMGVVRVKAKREVIVASGAIGSPQVSKLYFFHDFIQD